MLENISINTSAYSAIASGIASKSASNISFGECLANAMSSDSLLSAAPDRWAYKLSDKFAVDAAVDFLRENFGIDAYERTPTHTITEEQKEWLASRHDLNNLCGDNFPDLGENGIQTGISTNFKADLVYLGILSPDEARMLGAVPVYPQPIVQRVSGASQRMTSGTAMDLINDAISQTRSQIDYVEKLLMDKTIDHTEDEKYIDRAKENIIFQKSLYDILLFLYA